jgi:hypothetical protein
MVGVVEEVMNCVTDGMAKEWGTRDQEEKESEENGRQEGKEALDKEVRQAESIRRKGRGISFW